MIRRRRTGRKPGLSNISLTIFFIAVNVIFFFIFSIFLYFFPEGVNFIAVKPGNIIQGSAFWTILTSMFMHAGIFHLFVNMFSLFFLGGLSEQIIGRKRFLWLYLISGIIGSLFFVGFAYAGQFVPRGAMAFGTLDSFAVGASGALFGLLGLLAVLIPHKKVYLIVGPLIVIILQITFGSFLTGTYLSILNVIASILVFVMIFSLFYPNEKIRRISLPVGMPFWITPIVAIVPLVIIAFFVELPIGNSAHFGGLVAGLIYGSYLRNKYYNKVRMLNKIIR